MEPNRSIKNRLFQTLGNRSPKAAFLLEEGQPVLAPILKPKKSQDTLTPTNAKTMPMYKSGKLLLNQLPTPEVVRKKPQEVPEEKLSRQAKSMLDQGKNRLRTNLKPHDIFQLYESFPEMLEDFFYLNRVTHPYDYQIVTYAQRNPLEYMTISSQGVTLYHDKEAEFLTREQWLRDEKRYYQLQKIYFFKQYKLSKNFRIWKNKMRRHYMREMSGILSEHLFLTLKYPRNCLLTVRAHANSLRDSLSFFPFDTMEKLSPGEFQALMNDYRQKVLLKSIKEITNQITSSLQVAVAEEINKFKTENNIKIEGVNEKQGSKEGYVYSQEAILRKQYRRVYKLIKLADSMLQQAKIEMVIKCLQQLIDRIRDLQTEDREPWVTCVATIQQGGAITWQPDCPALVSLFLKAISSHIEAISEHNEKIVQRESFTRYRMADVGDLKAEEGRSSFKLTIEESPDYTGLMTQIEVILTNEFQQTAREEELLQKFVDIYLRHGQLASMSTIFKENSAVELCNYVQEWKRDEKQMHQLAEDKKGRLILYNYSDLRRKILNVPRQTLTSFLALLPEETLTRCRQLVGESKALFDVISVYPTEIVSFARFNRAVKQAAERLDDIRSAGSQICLLIDLMGKNKLANLEAYNARKIEALNSITLLKNKVDESEAKENESLSKFKKDNEVQVAKIKTLIKDLATRFNSIDFNQTKVTAKEMKDILAHIREILPPINALEAQSRKIQEIEVELNLPQTEFGEVHQLYQNAKLVHEIWSCRDDWKTMLVGLYHRHYCEVDCAELRRSWGEFSNKISSLAKQLPDNDILKNLGQELSEVEVLIDTITALRSPNLEEKAWREISEYLAYQLGVEGEAELPFSNQKNPLYTVRWLLEINIPLYKEKIEFIVRKSEKERELIQHLAEYKAYLGNLSFELVPRKREVYLFTENQEIQQRIHLYLCQLYGMMDNQYSQAIKAEAENLIRHYEYVQQIMKAALQFGNVWSRYQSFFDGNSNSLKLLTKESKEFFSWQAQWKKIIKNITTDAVLFYKKVTDETTGANCSRSIMKQIAKINLTIDQVKKGLDDYLEKKRASFPRYFFLPDDQLLRMLASVDPREPITQSFVPLLYRHIERILYKEDTKDTLLGIISKEGDHFPLKNVSFKLQSEMEEILKQAEEQIKKRIGYLIRTLFLKYIDEELTREALILDNNAQVVLAIDAIAWVRLAEETYLCPDPIGDFYDWIDIQQAQIKELKVLLQGAKTAHSRFKLMQLMSQSIYQREKTEQLLQRNITSTDCYQWERIPKLCMNANSSEIYLKQLTTKLYYCYEFLGNQSVCFVTPDSERSWISIAQAITSKEVACLQGYRHSHIETVKELGYVIAQEVETVHISQGINFKNIERFISGAVFTGCWVCLNLPDSQQVLSFLAQQLNHVRKAMLDTNVEKSKAQFINSNVAFFITLPSTHCPLDSVTPSLLHRPIALTKPDHTKVFGIIADCLCSIPELGQKTVAICELMNDTFRDSFVKVFDKHAVSQILDKAASIVHHYQWLKHLKSKEFYEFIVCEVLDGFILPLLKKEDVRVYENLKSCIVPDYQKLKLRHPSPKPEPNTSLSAFLDNSRLSFLKRPDFMESFELFEKAITSSSLGVILYGEALSGKSTLINLVCMKLQEESKSKIKKHRIYHRAYNREEVFASDKSTTIFTEVMNDSASANWVIFDGTLSLQYLQIFGSQADRYLVPQVGAFPADTSKFKFICQTCDISTLSPSVIGSHSLVCLAEVLSVEVIVRKTIVKLEGRRLLANLQGETVEWLATGLIALLGKLENRSLLKSKQINLIYQLASFQITQRTCRTVEGVFALNWESMREKEKSMKKLVDKFVAWCAYWSLLGVVAIQDEPKLEKFINQAYRTEAAPDELSSSIIYPGCGLEVQAINGLRTQSSLEIPEKGILTNLLRSDLLSEVDHQKGNKFYEEIVISEPQVIRVNYQQSNKHNYISQLSFLTDTPLLMLGAPNSGKKSILELFAKNMRNKSQFYSLRYRTRETLAAQIERPFRKLVALQGTVMKSVSASKKLIISIEDVSMTGEHVQTSELLRMIFNEKGYYNKQAQWMRFSNCCFTLLSSRLTPNPDNLRLLPKTTLFQTNSNITDKLQSIYAPYLKSWSAFNGLSGEVERIFTSQSGDTLLDATLSVFKMMEEMHVGQGEKGSLEKMLLKPRMGDITKVLTYICKTPEASHYNLTYYYQLWTHEIVRVFGDRLSSQRQKEQLFKEIKKESLVKFKQNFTLSYNTMFNFTSLGIENQNCYIRVEDPSFLHTYISNLLEADQINLPLKFLFDELLQHLIKIYRILTVEGAHLLLLSHNSTTARYLIELACQVGQNDYYHLHSRPLSVERHIEPTLYYKDNVCITEDINSLSQETTYQMACLLNYNVYDFGLKGELREKVKLSLNKKEKIEVEKKESKVFSKTKTEQVKVEQREEDIETLMAEQFMNYAHFVFQASPISQKLKNFISRQHDIVGQLQFNWIDIPKESILKVAKQILSFDQQTSQLILQGQSNDKLIQKVRIIFDTNAVSQRYFNDILIISELVKSETARLNSPLFQEQKDIKQAKELYTKVVGQISEKEQKMKCLQEDIEQINAQLEEKCKELEDVNNKITEWQMTGQENNGQGLSDLRVQREEVEIELKLIKERKEQLESEKKKILKSIKIANDYLEIFDNSPESFDRRAQEVEEKINLLQDKLILVWSMASYLIKQPIKQWIPKVNQWISAINSKVPHIACEETLLAFVQEVCPFAVSRSQLFCTALRIKLEILILLLSNYEQTSSYGKILKVHDPKDIFSTVLQHLSTEDNMNYCLLKSFPSANREARVEIETLCKMKNGLILIESDKDIEELQLNMVEKKMTAYMNKIIVISDQESSHLTLQCDQQQLFLSVENTILKEINPGMFQEKIAYHQSVVKELKRKEENQLLFYRAASTLNIETETYTEELNKYKNILSAIQQNLKTWTAQCQAKKYLQMAEFQMHHHIYNAILSVWNKIDITFKHLPFIYHQSKYLRNGSQFEQMSLEEKGSILKKFVNVNLGNESETLQNHYKLTKKWDNKTKVYVVKPSKRTLQLLQVNKEYKLINMLAHNNIIPHINETSTLFKVLYNFIPALHLSMLSEVIELQHNDTSQRIVPLIVMTEVSELKELQQTKIKIVQIEFELESPNEVEKESKNKWADNLKKYLINLTANKEHTSTVMNFIEKCSELAKNQQQLTRLISDILPFLHPVTILNFFNFSSEDISPYLYPFALACDEKERRCSQDAKNSDDFASFKDELPFIFNIAEFLPSKDPIAAELVSECVQFNKKLKEVKEKFKESQYQWEESEKVVPSCKTIQCLNSEYQTLRKNLIKLHLLGNSNNNPNSKAASHKTFSQGNLLLQNALKLPVNMLNIKTFNLIRCKAAKKFKAKLANVYLVWKVCNASFNFEENSSFAELSLIVEGKISNGKLLQKSWNVGAETSGKIEIVAFAVQSIHEPKQNPQSLYVPIKNQNRTLGHLQILKGELSPGYITSLEVPEIVIENTD